MHSQTISPYLAIFFPLDHLKPISTFIHSNDISNHVGFLMQFSKIVSESVPVINMQNIVMPAGDFLFKTNHILGCDCC